MLARPVPRRRGGHSLAAELPRQLSCRRVVIRRGRGMPKGQRQSRRAKPKSAPRRPRAAVRRLPPAPARGEAGPGRARSQIRQLAAEVERLERELEAARSQMVQLAARAEIDPLTDVLNRRGFERELKRSLAYVKRHG